MPVRVEVTGDGPCLRDDAGGADVAAVNGFLAHLAARAFSPATVRAYAYDLLNFVRFCAERGLSLGSVSPADVFAYLDWQGRPAGRAGGTVVRLAERRGTAPATINRRIAAVRGLFEYLVMTAGRTPLVWPAGTPPRAARPPGAGPAAFGRSAGARRAAAAGVARAG
jgi:integrase/recombinase XerC